MSEAEPLLTPAELELMQILWDRGPATTREVLDALPPGRDRAYTTVSTILRILEQKGFVVSRKQGRGHVYLPALERPRYEARTLRHMLGTLFGGSAAALVRRLVDSGPMDPEERAEIEQILKGED